MPTNRYRLTELDIAVLIYNSGILQNTTVEEVTNSQSRLLSMGLTEVDDFIDEGEEQLYPLTDRGEALLDHLIEVPLPKLRLVWTRPEEDLNDR